MAKCAAYALIWGPTFNRHTLHLIDKLAGMGFDGIEIPLVTGILKDLPVSEMKRRLADTGLDAVFCTGLDEEQDLASASKEKRERGILHLKKCVETVKEFGGDILSGVTYGVWGGFSGFPPTEEELQRSADCLCTVCEYASALGVDIAIEPINRFEGYLIATAEEGLHYLELVGCENSGLHLDTFQMNIEENSLPAAIESVGKKLFHFHICASHRGVPGEGHIDWPAVFASLREIGYSRWLTVESFSPDPGSQGSAAKVWRRLAASQDDIALAGLNLVRRYLG
ncbi:MAG TPA: sugar phosphate isomerase/epimerase family protein [Spirochaetia bacterium]|nr:sugar phosphate isomerase/epimerase family protein [Spirochaetia bacterium]